MSSDPPPRASAPADLVPSGCFIVCTAPRPLDTTWPGRAPARRSARPDVAHPGRARDIVFTIGAMGVATRLELGPLPAEVPSPSAALDVLEGMLDEALRDPAAWSGIAYRVNPTLFAAGGRLRYFATDRVDESRVHRLVVVEPNDYLDALITHAEVGVRVAELTAVLMALDEDVTVDEAHAYLRELTLAQLLVPDMGVALTGADPLFAVLAALRSFPGGAPVADRIESARSSPAHSQARLRPAVVATLGPAVVDELRRGVTLLHRLVPAADRLTAFRDSFYMRFGDEEVPLLEALDEEVGVGFEGASDPDEDGPLLGGLRFPPDQHGASWTRRERLLLAKIEDARHARSREIVLDEADVEALSPINGAGGADRDGADRAPLPGALAAVATLAAPSTEALDRGELSLLLEAVIGPPGARPFGHLAGADPALREAIAHHLHAEEALRTDAVHAELIHLPAGPSGRALGRPLLRRYEIPCLGRSGAPVDDQLPLADLRLSVVDERLVLRSVRLGREVLPRVTVAESQPDRSSPAVYRFLRALADEGRAGPLEWSWGALADQAFLPRVRAGRVVLARARWRLRGALFSTLTDDAASDRPARALARLRSQLDLPRHVSLLEQDGAELPLDLDAFEGPDAARALAELTAGRAELTLLETFPSPAESCLRALEGSLLHSLVVPFVRSRAVSLRPLPSLPRPTRGERLRPPGSEWLHVKLYTGLSTADRILTELVVPVAERALAAGAADGWHFLRYVDPRFHLRLRLHGDPARLLAEVLPDLLAAATPFLDDGRLHATHIDTYHREVERYGGRHGIGLAERIFHADSEAVAGLVADLAGEEGAQARWRLGLVGIDRLVDDLGLRAGEKRDLFVRVRDDFRRRHGADAPLIAQMGARCQAQEEELTTLLGAVADEEHPLGPGLARLAQRSRAVASAVSQLRAHERAGRLSRTVVEMAPSFIHMFANRLLRSAALQQELVLYELLCHLRSTGTAF